MSPRLSASPKLSASRPGGGAAALGKSAQDPKRPGQCGEIRYQGQDERGSRYHAELAHGRQVGQCEREKAAGVDERGKEDWAGGGEHGAPERIARRTVRAALLKVIKKMPLIVLGRAENGRADENRRDVER